MAKSATARCNAAMRQKGIVLLLLVLAGIALAWWLQREPLLTPVDGDGADNGRATAAASATLSTTTASSDGATDADAARLRAGIADAGGNDPFAAQRTGYRGRVVTTAGQAVPGMRVRLFRGAPDIALLPGLDVFTREPLDLDLQVAASTSGADGRFALDGVMPHGICWLRLQWADVQSAPEALRAGDGTIVPVQRTPAPGEVVDLGDVVLKRGAVLTGRVVDEDGNPIAGARVRSANLPPVPLPGLPLEQIDGGSVIVVTLAQRGGVYGMPGWFDRFLAALPLASTTSAVDGTFALYGVDPGPTMLGISAVNRDSILRQGIRVEPASTMHLGDIALADGVVATVSVTTKDGKPVAGAEVALATQSLGIPVHLGRRSGTTAADGRLEVIGVRRGQALAAARRSPRDPWVLSTPAPADSTFAIELPSRCALVLDVRDAAGVQARDVRLQLVAGEAEAGVLELAMFGAERGIDLASRLQRLDDGRLRIDDLACGPYRLVVSARDCGITALQLDLAGDAERTVQLRPARGLAVVVRDAAGEPVAGAAIYSRARSGDRMERIVDVPLHQGTTDADGRCLVRDLPTASARITAAHPAYGQVHAEFEAPPAQLDLQFLAAAAIEGQLTDGGRKPAPGRWVVVLERRGDGRTARGSLPDMPVLQLPDLEGAFAFRGLQPGNWRVTVQDSATDVGTIGGLWQYLARRKQIFPWNQADVELRPGEQATVRIDAMVDAAQYNGPGATIAGTVTIDGAPAIGALVVGTSQPGERRVTSRVDAAGCFDLGYCPFGELRVVVVPRDVAESRLLENLFSHHFAQNVTVVDGAPQQLHIAIVTSSVRGQVRDWNGAPVADCRIVLFDRGENGRSSALRSARCDGSGTFSFAQVPVGSYRLDADKDDFGKGSLEAVTISAASGDLTVVLAPTARVQGRVDLVGQKLRGVLVLTRPDGLPVRTGVAEDGRFELRNVVFGRYSAVLMQPGSTSPIALGELAVDNATVRDVVLRSR